MAQEATPRLFSVVAIIQWFFKHYECRRCATPAWQLEDAGDHQYLPDEDVSAWVSASDLVNREFPITPQLIRDIAIRFVQEHGPDWVEKVG